MTKDEALRLALEFIPSISPAFICEASHHKKHEQHASNESCPHVAKQKQVYEAIKAALEAKGEPVAWRDAAIRLGEELSSVGPDSYYDMNAKEWLDWAMKQKPRGEHSLPQRTWVGLTDEEIQTEWLLTPQHDKAEGIWFGRRLEAKLRSKND